MDIMVELAKFAREDAMLSKLARGGVDVSALRADLVARRDEAVRVWNVQRRLPCEAPPKGGAKGG